jgi:hypothetical protein
MESWRLVWRQGFAPVLPTEGLLVLAEALRTDDPRLMQGGTTSPPPFMCVQDWPVEAACAMGLIGAALEGGLCCSREEWRPSASPHTNPNACTVGEAEEFFARACFDCDQRMGKPAECRWFLNWYDDTPRDEMRRELLPEVERVLAERGVLARATEVDPW